MPKLSPAAQAIYRDCLEASLDWDSLTAAHFSTIVSASLRSLAENCFPGGPPPRYGDDYEGGVYDTRRDLRLEILDLAVEIENHA